MTLRILRWLMVSLVLGTWALVASAQAPGPSPPQPPTPPAPTPVKEEPRPPVPEYALAILFSLIILTAVCMPSRKR